jgi:hypothetical protein
MAITMPVKRSKLDTFSAGAPDAQPVRELKGKKEPLSITLPVGLIEKMDEAALRQDRSRAAMIAIALTQWLEREQKKAA